MSKKAKTATPTKKELQQEIKAKQALLKEINAREKRAKEDFWEELTKYADSILAQKGGEEKFKLLDKIIIRNLINVAWARGNYYEYYEIDYAKEGHKAHQEPSKLFVSDPRFDALEKCIVGDGVLFDPSHKFEDIHGCKTVDIARVFLITFAFFYRQVGDVAEAIQKAKKHLYMARFSIANMDTLKNDLYKQSLKIAKEGAST